MTPTSLHVHIDHSARGSKDVARLVDAFNAAGKVRVASHVRNVSAYDVYLSVNKENPVTDGEVAQLKALGATVRVF